MASGMGSTEDDSFLSTIDVVDTNLTAYNDTTTAVFEAFFSGGLSVTLLLYILVALCTAIFLLIICMVMCLSRQIQTLSRYNSVQTTLVSKATSISGLSRNGITSSTSSFDSKQPPYLGMLHNFHKSTATPNENQQSTSNSIGPENGQSKNKQSTPIMSDDEIEMHNSLVLLTSDQSVIWGNAATRTTQSTAFYPELSCNEPIANYNKSCISSSLPPQCFPDGFSGGSSAPIMSVESTPSFTSPSDAEWLSDHRIFMRSESTTHTSSDALFDTALGNLSSGEFPTVDNTNCCSFKSTTSETDPLVPKKAIMSTDTSTDSFRQKDHLPLDVNGHPRAWFVPLDAMCHEPLRHSAIDISNGGLLTSSQTTSSHLNLSAEKTVADKKQYASEQTLVSDSEYDLQAPEDELKKRLIGGNVGPAKQRITSWEKREHRPVIVIESRGKKISTGVSGRGIVPPSAGKKLPATIGKIVPATTTKHSSHHSRIPVPTHH